MNSCAITYHAFVCGTCLNYWWQFSVGAHVHKWWKIHCNAQTIPFLHIKIIFILVKNGNYIETSTQKTENSRIGIFYPLSFPDFDHLAQGSMGRHLLICCKCPPWTVVLPLTPSENQNWARLSFSAFNWVELSMLMILACARKCCFFIWNLRLSVMNLDDYCLFLVAICVPLCSA